MGLKKRRFKLPFPEIHCRTMVIFNVVRDKLEHHIVGILQLLKIRLLHGILVLFPVEFSRIHIAEKSS
jgi:hypothetical protein